ncbi:MULTISPECIES: phosphogluconate dehydrogenase (NAD(+)-dependent, decarboxylating) [Paraburkholderia]|uniref:6-phosphogluconate dehydrogenase (Decarboxylating) n=1 Tax=Paraburkholderia megapolitana TaxID=420953 RepID=A0A1I3T8F4_9BURK|nr:MULTISPECIES: decarboxylating 6-phosphogluconate dehydrogenase [Paraburkholderia]MCX4164941.1 decarboxylating 6-phosphogluconate dehydrogenase [Paraburkholderia megapolitana]MDN7160434.1 decarboxylating 6-phosphogluconate dehydrogenase [Paraburkholderia sp. CHISQ3]MDQ6497481.1 decarboxylating 6-phosphogluconate dehydrogenase [Paraburkholderia megapolitana]QDQ81428.1 decarboxylating 6-phosphogluconate dehydrogenase [Paraburkholderia megapolitana]SFJ65787.1 6-phosphogluconate dehydrogenase (d
MQIGIVGLGRMGGNIGRRLMRNGHTCVVYDHSPEATEALVKEGATGSSDLGGLVKGLAAPRVIWLMLPAGKITEDTLNDLYPILSPDDVVIDGGNSFYKDDIRRAVRFKEKGIHYVDVGTSGGVWGLERGYCMMIGGEEEVVHRLDPILSTLAPGAGNVPLTPGREGRDTRVQNGYMHTGPTGSGHFVKMVHNGIEYGLMQAYAEGFDILKHKASTELPESERFSLDLADVAEVWRRGSVVSSWLLDLTAGALAKDGALGNYSTEVADSGEGRWTIEAAIEEAVPAQVLSAALYTRFRSRDDESFAERMLSAMRFGFGGHHEFSPK